MGKLNVFIDEQESGFLVQFQSREPGRAGLSHACSEIGQALDLIMDKYEREQPTTGSVGAVVTTHDIGGQ